MGSSSVSRVSNGDMLTFWEIGDFYFENEAQKIRLATPYFYILSFHFEAICNL